MAGSSGSLIIACGALAWEIMALIRTHGWTSLEVQCLPAIWHNTPQKIPDGVRQKIRENRDRFDNIFVAYGDCGTGGLLDEVLEEEGVERIDGAHCYQFYMGTQDFDALHDNDPTCFYLTDYLAKHFDTLIWKGLGIDRHPELLPMYFGNYTAVVYLAQIEDEALQEKAKAAADKLGLEYRYIFTGYGGIAPLLAKATS
ncbi:MAG: DUF1638 domain-containing protein [Pseudomonadota bacterium]